MFHAMTRTIGTLIFPEFQLLDATGPMAALEIASRGAGPLAYRNCTLSLAGGPVRSSAGVTLMSAPAAEAPPLDTLLVAGGWGSRAAARDPAVLDFVARQAVRCRRVASVCTGAFVLAAAGLLDGRRATTHWRQADRLARLYPAVRVEP